MRKPEWSNAPEWAKWLAQSADGIWDWFETKPKACNFGLYANGTFMCAGNGRKECASKEKYIVTSPNKEWRKTIEKRPKEEVEEIPYFTGVLKQINNLTIRK